MGTNSRAEDTEIATVRGVRKESLVGPDRAATVRSRYLAQTSDLTDEQAEAVADREMGYTAAAIARELDRAEGTVNGWLDRTAAQYCLCAIEWLRNPLACVQLESANSPVYISTLSPEALKASSERGVRTRCYISIPEGVRIATTTGHSGNTGVSSPRFRSVFHSKHGVFSGVLIPSRYRGDVSALLVPFRGTGSIGNGGVVCSSAGFYRILVTSRKRWVPRCYYRMSRSRSRWSVAIPTRTALPPTIAAQFAPDGTPTTRLMAPNPIAKPALSCAMCSFVIDLSEPSPKPFNTVHNRDHDGEQHQRPHSESNE
jgi:hypothetical protein